MATPTNVTYTASSPIYGGRSNLPSWVPDPGYFWNLTQTNTIRSVDPAHGATGYAWTGNNGSSAITDVWNGGNYAPDIGSYGAVMAEGGGHATYYGYEHYLGTFNADPLGALTYSITGSVSNGPDPDIVTDAGYDTLWGSSTTGATVPNGTPTPPHCYAMEEVIPASLWGNTSGAYFIASLGPEYTLGSGPSNPAVAAIVGAGPYYATTQSWTYDLDTKAWAGHTYPASRIPPTGDGLAYCATVLDPVNEKVYAIIPGSQPADMPTFDIATKAWSAPAITGNIFSASGPLIGGWCGMHDLAVWKISQYGNYLYVYNPLTHVMTDITANVSGAWPSVTGDATDATSLIWCPHPSVQKFYCFSRYGGLGGDQLSCWTLTPPASSPLSNAWTWGTETFATAHGQSAISEAATTPRYNGYRWAEALKCFVHIAGTNQTPSCVVYRPAGAT